MARKPGKRVGQSLYLHRSALDGYQSLLVARATAIHGSVPSWNVFKLDRGIVSLLFYPRFWDLAFPALRQSVSVNLADKHSRVRRYAKNPPILHRKELMLPLGHPSIPELEELTLQCEQLGLFKDTSTIGRRDTWLTMLANAGVRLDGLKLVPL